MLRKLETAKMQIVAFRVIHEKLGGELRCGEKKIPRPVPAEGACGVRRQNEVATALWLPAEPLIVGPACGRFYVRHASKAAPRQAKAVSPLVRLTLPPHSTGRLSSIAAASYGVRLGFV